MDSIFVKSDLARQQKSHPVAGEVDDHPPVVAMLADRVDHPKNREHSGDSGPDESLRLLIGSQAEKALSALGMRMREDNTGRAGRPDHVAVRVGFGQGYGVKNREVVGLFRRSIRTNITIHPARCKSGDIVR